MHRFFNHSHERVHRGRHAFGHMGWGREFGRHERGHRAERVFEQGDLRLLLLSLIAQKSRHGYELIKAVEDSVGGAYSPSPGVVYPTLSLLEDLGYARAEEAESGKKAYSITPEGTAFLEATGPSSRLRTK